MYMAKRQLNRFLLGLLFLLIVAVLPAKAQDAAFDQERASGAKPHASNQQMAVSASGDNKSNLRHWNRFSTASARPLFQRVPAGTRPQGAAVSRYVRPKLVAPGSAVKQDEKKTNGPVRRYLAYNLPAGAFAKKNAVQSSPTGVQVKSAVAKIQKPQAHKTRKSQSGNKVAVWGYGSKSGEVVYSMVPASRSQHISCYTSYH